MFMPPQRGILDNSRERLCECGAVREVRVQNLVQLGMRYAKTPAADRCNPPNDGVIQCVAKGVSSDHFRRTHNDGRLLPSLVRQCGIQSVPPSTTPVPLQVEQMARDRLAANERAQALFDTAIRQRHPLVLAQVLVP